MQALRHLRTHNSGNVILSESKFRHILIQGHLRIHVEAYTHSSQRLQNRAVDVKLLATRAAGCSIVYGCDNLAKLVPRRGG